MIKHKTKIKSENFLISIKKIENTIKSERLIDLNCLDSALMQSFAIKKNNNIKPSARFLSGKMLMFGKLSLMFFIYELVETF